MKLSIIGYLKRLRLYHRYFRQTGFYQFVWINALKVIAFIVVLLVLLLLFQNAINDYRPVVKEWLSTLNWIFVFVVFLGSETFFGLLPPDFFIVWAKQFIYPYLAVGVLSVLSYAGGTLAYFMGYWLSNNEWVRSYLTRRYAKFFRLIKQWGGLFIVAAALFPIPYSFVCILVGMVRYPVRRFLFYAAFRILRFFIYAFILFAVIR